MRFANRAGLTVGAVAAVLALAGCGSSGDGSLLTAGAATQLTSELNQASSALSQYNCNVAYTAITEYEDDVNQLAGVNATLVQMLAEGGSRISTLANELCPSGVSSDTTTSASTATTTSGTTTGATVTTSPATTTTTSESDTGSGGAAPTSPATTPTTPPVVSTPTVTSSPETTTTPDSGGAGLDSSTEDTGGTGPGGGSE